MSERHDKDNYETRVPLGFKVCVRCGETKPLSEFHRSSDKRDGRTSLCKPCACANTRAYNAAHKAEAEAYRQANREHMREVDRKWYAAHPEHRERKKTYSKQWREANQEKATVTQRVWRQAHREWRRQYENNRNKDPRWRIANAIGGRMREAIADRKAGRHWENLVGYTLCDLMAHLESHFLPGMTWQNYGAFGWHIDHVRPITAFQFEKPEDRGFKDCWALENLQPLWWYENMAKGIREPALLLTDQRVRVIDSPTRPVKRPGKRRSPQAALVGEVK